MPILHPDLAVTGPALLDQGPLAVDGRADRVVERVECGEDLVAVGVHHGAPWRVIASRRWRRTPFRIVA